MLLSTVQIKVQKAGKKFNTEWILRNVELEFNSGDRCAFIGSNGSGKSTLIQLLLGIIPLTEGNINYHCPEDLHIDDWYKTSILASPYIELIEEFTLTELVDFHQQFKSFKNKISTVEFLEFTELAHAKHKPIRHFSSGMKQRLRLALAFQTDVPLVFLDEPTSNLDAYGTNWYLKNLESLSNEQIVIIGSNQPYEYEICKKIVSMADYK